MVCKITKKECLIMIQTGMEKWNTWRERNPDDQIDLCNMDFSNWDLNDYNFSNTNMQNVKFCNCKLKNTNFKGARLRNSDFSYSHCYKTNFESSYLTGAIFISAHIDKVIFDKATLIEVDMTNINHRDLETASYVETEIKWVRIIMFGQEVLITGHF